jgi:hypothetical protein
MVENLLIGLCAAAVGAATKLCLADNPIAAEVGGRAVDWLAGRLSSARDRRRFHRLVEHLEETALERLEPIVEHEFRGLPEHERAAAIQAVTDAVDQASLSGEDLFAADLSAKHLEQHISSGAPDMTRDLSEDVAEFGRVLLREMCGSMVEIARSLGPFVPNALVELLRRDHEIIELLRDVLARMPDRGTDDGFEYNYRRFVADKLDHAELFGVTATGASRRYPLSVAYLSLTAVRVSGDTLTTGRRIEELLADRKRIFIRGEAGLGKTTLLQWLAVRSALSDFRAPIEDWNHTVPFFVPLRRYAETPLPAPEEFLSEMGRPLAGVMPERWVHKQLTDGRALVLVDGVDELAVERRADVRTWLRDLATGFPDARYVITSRPSGAEASWLPDAEFSVLELQPLAMPDIHVFATRWYDAMRAHFPTEADGRELDVLRTDLLDQLGQNPHLRRLAQYPLLCALLCALHRDRHGVLPDNRMELYEVALQMLLDRRDAERRIPTLPGLNQAEKLVLLSDLAYWLIRNGLNDTSSTAARERFAQRLTAMPQITHDAGVVYRHLLERTGLLREQVHGRVDFVHRSFQEYLAARSAVVDADDLGVLGAHAHLESWYDVVVLAVGHASRRQRADLLHTILARGDAEPRHREQLWLVALASLETAVELDPALRGLIEGHANEVIPPRSLATARSFAAASPFVLARLAEAAPATEDELVATIRAIASTGLAEALPLLARYGRHEDRAVQQELLRNWTWFDGEAYAREVLAELPVDRLDIDDVTLMPGLKHLTRIRHVTYTGSPAPVLDSLPRRLTSLALLLREPVELGGLAGLPLETLVLRANSDETEVDLAPLAACSRLTTFEAAGVRVRNLGALSATPVTTLRLLDAVPRSELAAIGNTWELADLVVTDVDDLEDLHALRFAAGLRTLEVRECRALRTVAGIESWSGTLTHLTVSGCPSLDVRALAAMSALVVVDVGTADVDDLAPLGQLTALRSLTVGSFDDPRALASIRHLPNLRELVVRERGLVDLSVLDGCDLTVSVGPSTRYFGVDRLSSRVRVRVLGRSGERSRPVPRRGPAGG